MAFGLAASSLRVDAKWFVGTIRHFASFHAIFLRRVVKYKLSYYRMVKMRPETKKRIQTVIKFSKTAFHWGFIPLIIYLGKVT